MDLGAVMDEVGNRLDAIDGLRVYRYPADNVQVPAAVVTYPETYTYDETYGRGMDRLTLPVVLLVGKVSDRASRDRISDWLSRSGVDRVGIDNTSQLTKYTISTDGTFATSPAVSGGYLQITLTTGVVQGISNLRDVYIRNDVVGTDFHARTTFDPPFIGDPDAGGPLNAITPQHGLVLRYQRDTKQRAVVVWQNIAFGLPSLNVGVWQANLDGTGFTNRQAAGFPFPFGLPLPYTVEVRLTGNICRVREWHVGDPVPPWSSRPASQWTDADVARTVNLDTDAGDAVAIPTPTGTGGAGLVSAHVSSDVNPPSMVRYPLADTYFELASNAIKEVLEADSDSYVEFDTLRVQSVEFDDVQVAGVEYLAATLTLDIAGLGAS